MAVQFGEREPRASQGRTALLKRADQRSRPRFSMLISPDDWEWVAKRNCWLPKLGKMPHDPGVQGVSYNPDTKHTDTSAAESYHRGNGRIVVANGDRRLLGVLTEGEFRTRWPAVNGRYAYGWIWEGFEVVKKNIQWTADVDLRDKVRAFLVTSGILPVMSPQLKRVELRVLNARISRLTTTIENGNTRTSTKVRLAAAETLREAWTKDLEKSGPAEVPTRNTGEADHAEA